MPEGIDRLGNDKPMNAAPSPKKGLIFHEGMACDAVIQTLEVRMGMTRRDLRSPEKERAIAPIEFTFKIADLLFAFEHTGIEPFAGPVRLSAEATRDLDPIKHKVTGQLPPDDHFELLMPARAMQGLKRREREQAQEALANWVQVTAPTLPRANWGRYVLPIKKVMPPGVPFEVSLHRSTRPPEFPGSFSITHLVTSADLPEDRKARLREACARKFPKLAAWKRDEGARTILVLEDNDIQLSNPQVIYDAYASVEREFSERPDEVHVVTTIIEPSLSG